MKRPLATSANGDTIMEASELIEADDFIEADTLLEADDFLVPDPASGMSEQPGPAPKPIFTRPWRVIMDFDRTITKNDTVEALVCQCILHNYEHVIEGGGNLLQLGDVANTEQGKEWERCKREYANDYSALEDGLRLYSWGSPVAVPAKKGEEKTRIYGHAVTFQDEVECCESAKPIEEFSMERVNGTGIFDHVAAPAILKRRAMLSERHLTPLEIAAEGRYPQYGVSIRKGFPEFIEELGRRPHSDWGVVSVNWSSDWIKGIILASLGRNVTDEITVISNNPSEPSKPSDDGRRGIAGPSPSVDPVRCSVLIHNFPLQSKAKGKSARPARNNLEQPFVVKSTLSSWWKSISSLTQLRIPESRFSSLLAMTKSRPWAS